MGFVPIKTEYVNKTVRLPKELISDVQQMADGMNMTFSALTIQALHYALKNYKKK